MSCSVVEVFLLLDFPPFFVAVRRRWKNERESNKTVIFWPEDGPEGWTYNKPFIWYQFPYPAVYHGLAETTPAKLRAKLQHPARYLWSFSGTGRGVAGFLRQALMNECNICNRQGTEVLAAYAEKQKNKQLRSLQKHNDSCVLD